MEIASEQRVDDRFDEETGEVNPSGWHEVAQNTLAVESGTLIVYVTCADRLPLHTSSGQ